MSQAKKDGLPESFEAALAELESIVQGMEAGHWLMRQKPAEFNACVRVWLDARP